jgi:hypothetical protein
MTKQTQKYNKLTIVYNDDTVRDYFYDFPMDWILQDALERAERNLFVKSATLSRVTEDQIPCGHLFGGF